MRLTALAVGAWLAAVAAPAQDPERTLTPLEPSTGTLPSPTTGPAAPPPPAEGGGVVPQDKGELEPARGARALDDGISELESFNRAKLKVLAAEYDGRRRALLASTEYRSAGRAARKERLAALKREFDDLESRLKSDFVRRREALMRQRQAARD